ERHRSRSGTCYQHQQPEQPQSSDIGIVNKDRGNRAEKEIGEIRDEQCAPCDLSPSGRDPAQPAEEREHRKEDERTGQGEIFDCGSEGGIDVGHLSVREDNHVIIKALRSVVESEEREQSAKGITASAAGKPRGSPLLYPRSQGTHVARKVDRGLRNV